MSELNHSRRQQPFRAGLIDNFSIIMATAIFGFVCGVLAHVQNVTPTIATLMSAIVFAGSAQLVVIQHWHPTHLPLVVLLSSSFIITLRFALMSMTLQPYFKGLSQWRVYLGLFFVIDETWAVTLLKKQKSTYDNQALFVYFISSGIWCYLGWIFSSWLGVYVGSVIKDPDVWGMDFAFSAVFLALAMGFWRGKRDLLPWIVAAVVALFSDALIPGNWYIILGALAGSLTGVWRELH